MSRAHSMIDSLVRRVRDWRRAIRIAAAIILLEIAGYAAWRLYDHWRLGRVELSNGGPPLVVQVLDESGETPIGEPFDLVARTTLTLPDGDYRLRVDGIGRLGRTVRLAVNRGETIAHELSLDDGRLLVGEPFPPTRDLQRRKEEPQAVRAIHRGEGAGAGQCRPDRVRRP